MFRTAKSLSLYSIVRVLNVVLKKQETKGFVPLVYAMKKRPSGLVKMAISSYLLIYIENGHICHKLWTEICEIWQFFKGDLIKFCEIFAKSLNLNVRSLW